MSKIAIIQDAPRILDREATLDKATQLIAEAAAEGARLIVFPEAFVPGYPAWVWRLQPGGDWSLCEQIHQRLLENAVDLARDGLATVRNAAREANVTVVMGINERDGSVGRTTLYNSLVVIGHGGEMLNHHRKLMPTNPERMVWGFGDASGLQAIDTPVGRIGALLCWENYMPLARFALYAQGIDIHIAPTYDSGESWIGSLRHIAREGGCWVIGAGVALRNRDLPDDFPERDRLYPLEEEWINPGDSVVVAPGGELVAGPMHEEQGILYAEIDPARAAGARRTFDVAGHYARPDIFTLQVNRRKQSPIEFEPGNNGVAE
ncbi:carbon-nitrogen hydrolase family protein [Sedimenticola sp.]|uniref:carbon-nitrogen hydrolase family protein n=1 Tax=Sedimenticola sp. TaxID=1940285 RepID=UPI003D128687